MKVYLEKFNDFHSVLIIDTEKSKALVQERVSLNDNLITGKYFNFKEDIIGIFCANKEMFLYYGNQIHSFIKMKQVNYYRKNQRAFIDFVDINDTYSFSYDFDEPISNLTYSEEDEDSDFGFWLSNIFNSIERRNIFIEYNSPTP